MATDDMVELRAEIERLKGATMALASVLGGVMEAVALKTGVRIPLDELLADAEKGRTAPFMREGSARVLKLIMEVTSPDRGT